MEIIPPESKNNCFEKCVCWVTAVATRDSFSIMRGSGCAAASEADLPLTQNSYGVHSSSSNRQPGGEKQRREGEDTHTH